MTYFNILISVFILMGFYIIYHQRQQQTQLLNHVEQNYPDEWQQFTVRATHLGSCQKWRRLLALDALKNNRLSTDTDATIRHKLATIQRDNQLLIGLIVLEMILGLTAALVR